MAHPLPYKSRRPSTGLVKSRAWRGVAFLLICLLGAYPHFAISQEKVKALETDIQKYQEHVTTSGKTPADEQGRIASYIGLPETWQNINACSDDDCPDLILFDKPLGQNHNLSFEVIGHNANSANDVPAGASPAILNWSEQSHGAAMAGIMAARRTSSGLVGVNPEAGLFSVDWPFYGPNPLQRSSLTTELKNILTVRWKHPKIFVLATGWESDPSFSFQSCEDRLHHDPLANLLVSESRPLVIVAAGNEENAGGRDIVRSGHQTPQNLGDCQNVVVVTACDKCSSQSPQIPSWASYSSEGLVHLAAYGGDVLTTTPNDRLTVMPGGTSAAAAFVAGVASAMVAKWPKIYTSFPDRVKTRLQVTSTPSLAGLEAQKVASGILNPVLAFADPSQDYVTATAEKPASVPVEGWCVDQIAISKTGGTEEEVIAVGDILRVYCLQPGRCVVYHADFAQRSAAVVRRSGPGQIHNNLLLKAQSTPVPNGASRSSQDEQQRYLFRAGGNLYRDGDFTDLLLRGSKQETLPGNCTLPPTAR
jgi:Subtilase family